MFDSIKSLLGFDKHKKFSKFGLLTYEKMNEQQKEILLSAQDKLSIISEALSIFSKNGIWYYEGCLAGGALRDLMLNNENKIKDFDFILGGDSDDPIVGEYDVTFLDDNSEENYRIEKNILRVKKSSLHDFFDQSFTTFIDEKYPQKYLDLALLYCIGQELIKKGIIINKVYPSNAELHGYMADGLIGVMKVNIDGIESDLLITTPNFSAYDFIASKFDFGLCQIYMPYCHSKDIKDIFQSIQYLQAFKDDLENKTLTYDLTYLSNKQIHTTILGHFVRVKEKYPEYKLLFRGEKINITEEEKNIFLELDANLTLKHEMNKNLKFGTSKKVKM